MGMPMALRVLEQGYVVVVTPHRSQERVDFMVGSGATEVPDLPSLGRASDVVVTVLPGPSEADEVVSAGLLQAMRPGSLLLEMSTIDADLSRDLSARCEALGIHYVDAPVDRGPEAARSGSLALFVGGSQADVEKLRPVLSCLATDIYHLGPAGSGHTLKLIKNAISQSMTALYAEGFVLAERAGIDRHVLLDILSASPAGSNQLVRYGPNFVSRERALRVAPIRTAVKDLTLAATLATSLGIRVSLPESALSLYRKAAALGLNDSDASSVALAVVNTHQSALDQKGG